LPKTAFWSTPAIIRHTTARRAIWRKTCRRQGLDVILKIEVQGGLQVRQRVLEAVLIFVQPPSLEVLRQRLLKRGTDSPEAVEQRLRIAEQEMQALPYYDYLVTNDDLEQAVDLLRAIILAERARIPKG
jgi:guanylate kinase